MSEPATGIDWSKTSFDGVRREQLSAHLALSFRERMEALDDMSALAERRLIAPATADESAPKLTVAREPGPAYAAAPPAFATAKPHDVELPGCTPTPLATYLKALAVLRLVTEQAGDRGAMGYWRDDVFVLRTSLDADALRSFFLHRYAPSPIISPWSGRAGFLEGEDADDSDRKGAKAVRRVLASRGRRVAAYRHTFRFLIDIPAIKRLNAIRAEVKRLEAEAKRDPAKKEEVKRAKQEQERVKAQLLPALRAALPDAGLDWFDVCYAMTDEPTPSPLFGTGGNEGSMDFSVNHVLALADLIDYDSDQPTVEAGALLDEAIFGKAVGFRRDSNMGFLSPAAVGGVNMTTAGFEGPVSENKWSAVLALEGVLFLAASAVRRHGGADSALSAPFFFDAVRGGHGAGAAAEKVRPEFWAPLWRRPVSSAELKALFGEGRAVIGRRPATTALDVARSLASLGVDRGVNQFQRFVLAERRGKGYSVATPLQRATAARNRHVDLLGGLDERAWLARVRAYVRSKAAPAAVVGLAESLESELFVLTQRPDRQGIQRVLRFLGRLERRLGLCIVGSSGQKAREGVSPMPLLSPTWRAWAADGRAEFGIARAMAGLRMQVIREGRELWLGLRPHVAPVTFDGRGWDPGSSLVCWGSGSIERQFAAMLHRRRLEGRRAGGEGEALHSWDGASLGDVHAFLEGRTDDRRIVELAAGLACVRSTADEVHEELVSLAPQPRSPHPAYALLKPYFIADSTLRYLLWLPEDGALRRPPEIDARLAANDVAGALRLAWHRLRTVDKKLPGREPPAAVGLDGPRLLAALAIPLSTADMRHVLHWLDGLAPAGNKNSEYIIDEPITL